MTALGRAGEEGDEEVVDRLLAQGADIEARDRDYMTPDTLSLRKSFLDRELMSMLRIAWELGR